MKRIYHPWTKWECYKSGFFSRLPEGINKKDAETKYCEFLRDLNRFEKTLQKVITEWKHSCEHNLTNDAMNKIAWLGQACLAYEFKIPAEMRAGFNLLSPEEQEAANAMAERYLNIWIDANEALRA